MRNIKNILIAFLLFISTISYAQIIDDYKIYITDNIEIREFYNDMNELVMFSAYDLNDNIQVHGTIIDIFTLDAYIHTECAIYTGNDKNIQDYNRSNILLALDELKCSPNFMNKVERLLTKLPTL